MIIITIFEATLDQYRRMLLGQSNSKLCNCTFHNCKDRSFGFKRKQNMPQAEGITCNIATVGPFGYDSQPAGIY